MGVAPNISHITFPKQGSFLGRRVEVAFNYDTAHTVNGTVLRDDVEEPNRMVILLDDGRVVLSTECQYCELNYPAPEMLTVDLNKIRDFNKKF